MQKIKLHLGCLNDYRKGWVNLDHPDMRHVQADVYHDLNTYPWPFATASVRKVKMIQVLEHLEDPLRAIKEIIRICQDGAGIHIAVPYANSSGFWGDLTHKAPFDLRWWELEKYGVTQLQLTRMETQKVMLGKLIPDLPLGKRWRLPEVISLYVPNIIQDIHTWFIVDKKNVVIA